MKKVGLDQQFEELVKQVEAFFARSMTEKQSREELQEYRNKLLASVPEMLEVLPEQPVYGAIAFLGRFQFVPCSEFEALSSESSAAVLKVIAEKKALRVAERAKATWDLLLKNNPEALASIVALCYLASKNGKIKKALEA